MPEITGVLGMFVALWLIVLTVIAISVVKDSDYVILLWPAFLIILAAEFALLIHAAEVYL